MSSYPLPPAPRPSRHTADWGAVWLLLFGGIGMGIGWVVGLVLLWSSDVWTLRQKWLGTLAIPGGLPTAFIVVLWLGLKNGETCYSSNGGPQICHGGPTTVMIVVQLAAMAAVVLTPVVVAVYLARQIPRSR